MVEYAILLAGTTFGSFTGALAAFASSLNWGVLSYILIALVILRLVSWAFRGSS
ncbi:MAG TPA: hypothetical protein VMN37_07740 [Gemmatimonadales bacterium]|nr:hypothetical protein [Gemmatimonadales bacterium]